MKTILILIASLMLASAAEAQTPFRTSLTGFDGTTFPNVVILTVRGDGIHFQSVDGRVWFTPCHNLCYADQVRFGYMTAQEERRRMAAVNRALNDPDPVRRRNSEMILGVSGR